MGLPRNVGRGEGREINVYLNVITNLKIKVYNLYLAPILIKFHYERCKSRNPTSSICGWQLRIAWTALANVKVKLIS